MNFEQELPQHTFPVSYSNRSGTKKTQQPSTYKRHNYNYHNNIHMNSYASFGGQNVHISPKEQYKEVQTSTRHQVPASYKNFQTMHYNANPKKIEKTWKQCKKLYKEDGELEGLEKNKKSPITGVITLEVASTTSSSETSQKKKQKKRGQGNFCKAKYFSYPKADALPLPLFLLLEKGRYIS